MIKDLEQRSLLKGKDVAENIAQWLDELYLGKYDLIPFFKVNKVNLKFISKTVKQMKQ